MRRCPGCTFQVCKPCLELRENEGRGLMHGNMMSSGGVATPTTQRTVRKKPLASTPGGGSGIAAKTKKGEDAVPVADGEGSEAKKAGVNGKKKEKVAPAPRSMVGTERAAQKKRNVPDTISEGSPSSSLDNDDEDFELGRTSPTPSKRRRTGLDLGTTRTSPVTTSRRAPRKPLLPAMPLPRSVSHPSITREPRNASSSMTSGPISLTEGDILYEFGVKGYDEPLLGRREPVVSNPVIKIPGIVKRNFKPRPTAHEIQRNIQKHTLKKMHEMHELHEERSKHIAAQRVNCVHLSDNDMITNERQKEAEEEAYPHTVRAFVEAEAMKHKDDDLLDRDEHEALCAAMRDAARKWAYRSYDGMDAATQNLVTRGMDMRLDLIDESYKTDLIQLLDQCAARKLQEMAYERAPTTAQAQNQAAGPL
ncbi:hypothetical protein N0V83_000822 [Neocucurbitaria cava]|uniref:Uncharacterized protein n=1 Tax=Neocucurbitaria cava TaxID=798079 RepID=A0A9W9CSD7_9PLEO|nr:hypothetical protein N0V83_000822 [Neocucurbitaria cava]